MKRILGVVGALVALLAALAVGPSPGDAADHIDAPLSRADLALDIGDIFIEQAPDGSGETLITVSANVAQAPGMRRPWATRDQGNYVINVDQDGDAKADRKVTVDFSDLRDDGRQQVRVRLDKRTIGTGVTGEVIKLKGGGQAIVDVFDDPFFLDFQAVLDDLEQLGGPRLFCDGNEVDFLGGLNTGAIVVQLPPERLQHEDDTTIGVWAATYDRQLGRVIDRMGQAEVPTFFIVDDEPSPETGLGARDVYNNGDPQDDIANFGDIIVEKLVEFSSRDDTPYTEEQAVELVHTDILPDILRFDTSSNDGIVDGNGRKVLDDGLDWALARATGGSLGGSAADPTDCIDANDVELNDSFPYLADAHVPATTEG